MARAARLTVHGLLAAALPAVGLSAGPAGAAWSVAADDPEPAVIDRLTEDEARRYTPDDVAGSVTPLEPAIRRLEPEIRELQTETRDGERTTVTISADVLFAFESAELSPQARRIVEDLTPRLAATDGPVLIVGHTDAIGSREYNQRLSEQRAQAVAAVLGELLPGDRELVSEGRNFSEPVVPESRDGGDDPEARARNRRVEISFDEPSD